MKSSTVAIYRTDDALMNPACSICLFLIFVLDPVPRSGVSSESESCREPKSPSDSVTRRYFLVTFLFHSRHHVNGEVHTSLGVVYESIVISAGYLSNREGTLSSKSSHV